VSNQQLYIAVGIPTLFNAVLIGVLIADTRAKFAAIDRRFDEIFRTLDAILASTDHRLGKMRVR